MDVNRISGHVVDSAMKVHSALGPGLLESAESGNKVGLLINFHELHLKDGIERIVHNL